MENASTYSPQSDNKSIGDYISLLRRRRSLLCSVALVVFLIGLAVAILLPPTFRSSAMILIEEPEVPPELVESTVTSYADQRIQLIKYRVITTPTLTRIIRQFDLYADIRKNTPLPEIIDKFRRDIDVETIEARVLDPRNGRPTRATIAFTLGYNNTSPAKAQLVANELVTLFLSENTRERQNQASATTSFLSQEAGRLGTRIQNLESKIAAFKRKHSGTLPHQLNTSIEMVDRTERDLGQVERRIRGLRERRDFLKAELGAVSAQVAAPGSNNGKILTPWQRLIQLRGELASLRQTLGPNHPQLIHVKNQVAALENILNDRSAAGEMVPGVAEKNIAVAALEGWGGEQMTDVSVNPLHVQLRTQLKATEVELAELLSERRSLSRHIKAYRNRIDTAPEVERAYQSLVRDYDNARKKYNETKDKQLAAELSQSLETERKSERFVLIEPPQRPTEAIGLGKLLIMAIGFVGAITAGTGSVLVLDMFDNRIYSPRQLAAVSGAEPLQVVPYIYTPAERRRRFGARVLAGASIIALGAGILACVHYFVVPLDTLWFRTVSDLRGLIRIPNILGRV